MVILKSAIFNQYPNIVFGFSTKIGNNSHCKPPYNFNMSLSVGDDKNLVEQNRIEFYKELGLDPDNIVYQKQIHTDNIKYVDKAGFAGESDALITDKPNLGLVVGTADCTPIFIYDKNKQIIAAIHSGWRSTQKKILLKTLHTLANVFTSNPKDLIVYIGPSISQMNYEVGEEVAKQFNQNFVKEENNKFYLDVAGLNCNILIEEGVPQKNIQLSNFCTYKMKNLLHSYRREGAASGRAIGVISMKGLNG